MDDLVDQLARRLAHMPWHEVEREADRLGAETATMLRQDLPCVSQARAEAIGAEIASALRRRWRQEQIARQVGAP